MIKFILKGATVKELPENAAEAVMRVLRKNKINFSKVGNTVHLRGKAALPVVLAF